MAHEEREQTLNQLLVEMGGSIPGSAIQQLKTRPSSGRDDWLSRGKPQEQVTTDSYSAYVADPGSTNPQTTN